jgi:phosphoglycolate phosphatase-like HAD superfamily hydrolase
MKKAIFFDFDGTLCDSSKIKTNAFMELYKLYGKDIQEKVRNFHIKNMGKSRFIKFKFYEEKLLNKKVTQSKLNDLSKKFSNIVKKEIIKAKPINGTSKILKILKSKNILSFVVSGTPDGEIKEIINKKGWNSFFNGVFGSPEVKEVLISKLIKQFKLVRTECLMVGDAKSDYIGAFTNKVDFIGISPTGENLIFPKNIKMIKNFNKFEKYLNY